MKSLKIFLIITLTAFFSSSATFFYEEKIRDTSALPIDTAIEVQNLLFAKAMHTDKLTTENIRESLAAGMAATLEDPHTIYIPAQDADFFNENVSGEFAGIGAELEVDEKTTLPIIVTPLPGGSAEKAGIKPGDLITKVDEKSISGQNLIEVVQKIRGKIGTNVKLEIARDKKFINFNLTRKIVRVESVEASMTGTILYIKIANFDDDTGFELSDKISDILAKTKPTGIVLDLRNNPGGYMDAAVDVLGEFLPRNKVAVSRKWNGGSETSKTDGLARLTKPKMAILINQGSASAAEIVAGALRDHDRATLFGETTFGKGTVQEMIKTSRGGLLKVTTSEWLTPKNHQIDKKGIDADFVGDFETAIEWLKLN